MTCKTNTRWEVKDGELVYVGSGSDDYRHIVRYQKHFPMPANKVAELVNEAFKLGMAAKVDQIQKVITSS